MHHEVLDEAVYGRLPVLPGYGDVTLVEQHVRLECAHVQRVHGNGFHELCGLVKTALPVQVVSQVVSAFHLRGVFEKPLAVVDIGLPVILFPERTVASSEVCLLGESGRGKA